MTLVVALPPLFWIAGRKTYNSWKRAPSKNMCFKEKKSKLKHLNNTKTHLLNNTTIGGQTSVTDTNNTQIVSKGLTFDNSKLNFNKEQAINGWNNYMTANCPSSIDTEDSSDSMYSESDSSISDKKDKFIKNSGSKKKSQSNIKVQVEQNHTVSGGVIYENTLLSENLKTTNPVSHEIENVKSDFSVNNLKLASRTNPGPSLNDDDKLKSKSQCYKPPLPPRPQKRTSIQKFDNFSSFSSSLNIDSYKNKVCDRTELPTSTKRQNKGKSLDNVFASLT